MTYDLAIRCGVVVGPRERRSANVSSPEVVELISRERASGADIAAEACPKYFLLRQDEILTQGAFHKFTPPYAGRRVQGRVVATYLRWTLLAQNGTLSADPGGQFLPGSGALRS